jgi:hypothetical protein
LYFETIFIFFFIIYFSKTFSLQKDRKNNIPLYGFRVFNNSESKANILDIILAIAIIIGFSFSIMTLYAQNVYSKLNGNFGGGHPIEKILYLKDDTINGNIIHMNERYIYMKKDSTIKQIKIDDINEYSK